MAGGSSGSRPTRWWLAVCLIPIVLPGCRRGKPPAPPRVAVTVVHPLQRTIVPKLALLGQAQAANSVDLVARVPAFLTGIAYADGAVVRKGQVLFTLDRKPYEAQLRQSRGMVDSAEASYRNASTQYRRSVSLHRIGAQSQADVDNAQATLTADRGALDQQKAALAVAQINLSYTVIKAPFNGAVTAHQASVGALVGQASPSVLATLVEVSPIKVTAALSASQYERLQAGPHRHLVGDAVEGRIDGAPDRHQGVVDYVAPQLDTPTGTVQLRAAFPNRARTILPGMFVRLEMPLAPIPNALLIPMAATAADEFGRYVFCLEADDTVARRYVQIGPEAGNLVAVTSGLTAADEIITDGLVNVEAGTRVRPRRASIAGAP